MSKHKAVEIIIVLAALATIFGFFWGVFTYLNPRSITPVPTPTPKVALSHPTISPSIVPTTTLTTQPSLPPTAISTSQPTATPSPTLSGPQAHSENIRLQCNCSDPVTATINQIVIQPDQTKMLWTMTFANNSQQSAYAAFADDNFYLQEGDQVNDPASGEPQFDATGTVIGTSAGIYLQAGVTEQVVITFSFIPYTSTPYTLITIMQMDCCGREIANFNPKIFTFYSNSIQVS